jgi:glycerol-3-phosphate dehydrogenase (NAD(P)+)
LATTHLEEVLEFSQCILIALPVQVIRKVLEGKDLREKVFISASKGLEVGTNKRVSEVLEELFPDCQVLALSGPSFAEETAKGLPCAVVLAGEDVALLREVRELFSSEPFRVYLSEDIVGAELGGALKNVIAIDGKGGKGAFRKAQLIHTYLLGGLSCGGGGGRTSEGSPGTSFETSSEGL